MTLISWRGNGKGLSGARAELILLQGSRSMKSKYIRTNGMVVAVGGQDESRTK